MIVMILTKSGVTIPWYQFVGYPSGIVSVYFLKFFLVFSVFSTGLVQLYIAGLPFRSCWTTGAPSVEGAIPMSNFHFWQQQNLNPRPCHYNADVLPLCYVDPPKSPHHAEHMDMLYMASLMIGILEI